MVIMKKIFYFILFFSILFNLSLLSYSFQNREKNIFYIKNIENFHTLDIMENSISKQIPNSSHLIELEKDSSKVENDNVEFAQSIFRLLIIFSIFVPFSFTGLFLIIYLVIEGFKHCRCRNSSLEDLENITSNNSFCYTFILNLNVYDVLFHFILAIINFCFTLYLMHTGTLPINLNLTFLYYLFFVFKNIFKLDNKTAFISSFAIIIFLTIISLGIFNLTYFLDLIKMLPNLKLSS
ncbi:hypothetical protein C7Y58_00810 [Fusobacterium nucleatum subsp. nucleatum ATCC 25586]|jgi:hypothetical protein|uniref:Uncharacterized protein n=3 Tax=Fusobacterium nucleatum TaxID=851 RepID=Q8RIE1_FUSNN|nr:unknown [Fusobacterium nucleatum subsp. nucleatum ATCC 25586]AVQ14198.1 hypothetical protein C7Y58_00810 [Fusobacterium nucleatum subsp. nucleatum ATCC 25586]